MLMSILKFFFGFGSKCDRFDRRYTNRGYASRIIMFLIYLVYSAAVVAFVYFCLPLAFEKNIILGILAVLVAIGFVFTVASEDAILAVVALKCFLVKNIVVLKDKIKEKKEKKKLEENAVVTEDGTVIENVETKTSNELNEEIAQEELNKKSYRLFDFFAIFLFAGLAVAVVVLSLMAAKSLV